MTGVTNLVLPDNTIEIADYAFYCSSITELTTACDDFDYLSGSKIKVLNLYCEEIIITTNTSFMDTVEKIYVSNNFKNLYNVTEDILNKYATIYNGVYYLGNKENPYHMLMGLADQSIETLTVNENTKVINQQALFGCVNLKEVKLPDNLSEIGYASFQLCSSLEKINIPKNITKILEYTFCETNLNSIEISENIIEIKERAFYGCKSLEVVVIPNTIEELGAESFAECTNLKKIVIGNVMFKIGENINSINYVFGFNNYFESIEIIAELETIGSNLFIFNTFAKELIIPNTVKYIGDYAFSNTNIEKISLPNTLIGIGIGAFSNSGISEIELPESLEVIGESAFYGTNLQSIVIPQSVKSVGKHAFLNVGLEKVYLYSTDCLYDQNAFYGTYVSEIHINSIDDYLTNQFANIEATPLGYGKLYLNGELLTKLVIPEGVVEISAYAFLELPQLESVSMPSTIKKVGMEAFYIANYDYISNLYIDDLIGWTQIDFESDSSNPMILLDDSLYVGGNLFNGDLNIYGVKEIKPFAFNSLKGLDFINNIIIGDDVITIGDYAFSGISSLESLTLGNNVQKIGDYAFDGSCIRELTISNSVELIGKYAFAFSENLRILTLGSGLQEIQDNAFLPSEDTEGITRLNISSIEDFLEIKFETAFSNPLSQSPKMFINGEEVTKVVVPDSITKINDYAFKGGINITEVVMGSNVECIGKKAFEECVNLETVVLSDSVKTIGEKAFYRCDILNLTLSENLEEIGFAAFMYNERINNLNLSTTIKKIEPYAFYGCVDLQKSIYFEENRELIIKNLIYLSLIS